MIFINIILLQNYLSQQENLKSELADARKREDKAKRLLQSSQFGNQVMNSEFSFDVTPEEVENQKKNVMIQKRNGRNLIKSLGLDLQNPNLMNLNFPIWNLIFKIGDGL